MEPRAPSPVPRRSSPTMAESFKVDLLEFYALRTCEVWDF